MRFLVLFLVFSLCGCFYGDKVYYEKASVRVINNKVCVYVSKDRFVKQENIVSISALEYGVGIYIFNKSYSGDSKPSVLAVNECVGDLYDVVYKPGKAYTTEITTVTNKYKVTFIVWKKGDELAVRLLFKN
ncbi:hypothetical protein CDR68_24670 [Salmonella enterica]|nr:hypothetical protein [Salmonella enterica]